MGDIDACGRALTAYVQSNSGIITMCIQKYQIMATKDEA
jgi:hypothetical protein